MYLCPFARSSVNMPYVLEDCHMRLLHCVACNHKHWHKMNQPPTAVHHHVAGPFHKKFWRRTQPSILDTPAYSVGKNSLCYEQIQQQVRDDCKACSAQQDTSRICVYLGTTRLVRRGRGPAGVKPGLSQVAAAAELMQSSFVNVVAITHHNIVALLCRNAFGDVASPAQAQQ